MKTIEQLLQLQKNPYYQFTEEEKARLNAFLLGNSEHTKLPKGNSKNSEKNIPATVHAKNVVHTNKGVVPTEDQVKTSNKLSKHSAKAS